MIAKQPPTTTASPSAAPSDAGALGADLRSAIARIARQVGASLIHTNMEVVLDGALAAQNLRTVASAIERLDDDRVRVTLDRIGFDALTALLDACDYDGTLAPLVEDPSKAAPLPEAVAALRSLAALPQTTAAVVSGRALRDLAALSRLPAEVHLVGSHGSEFDIGFVERLAPEQVALRHQLESALFTPGEKLIDGVAVGAARVLVPDRPVEKFFSGENGRLADVRLAVP